MPGFIKSAYTNLHEDVELEIGDMHDARNPKDHIYQRAFLHELDYIWPRD
jgi:hypothetical protein